MFGKRTQRFSPGEGRPRALTRGERQALEAAAREADERKNATQ